MPNILSVITVIFIILKVTHLIDWSWFLVLAPVGIELLILAIVGWGIKKIWDVLVRWMES